MKDEYYKVVGTFLKMKRLEKGVSINETAIALGHAKSWYYDIEIGRNRLYLKECIELCSYFNTDLKELQDYLENSN